MTDTCSHTCPPRRSRFLTPLAIVVGAVLLSGTSAYAASQITSAQIKNGTIQSIDVANGSLTGTDLKNHSVGGVDLKPGLANRLTSVLTSQDQTQDLSNSADWQWTLPTNKLYTFKVTNEQRFTIQGIVGYRSPAAHDYDVAICKSVNGGDITFMGPTYGTIGAEPNVRFNAPVQATTTASGVTLRVGPCLRGPSANLLAADVSSMTVLMTNP